MPLRFQGWKRGVALAATPTAQEPCAHDAEPPTLGEFWVSNDDSHLKRKEHVFVLILWLYLSLSSCSHWKSWPVIW